MPRKKDEFYLLRAVESLQRLLTALKKQQEFNTDHHESVRVVQGRRLAEANLESLNDYGIVEKLRETG